MHHTFSLTEQYMARWHTTRECLGALWRRLLALQHEPLPVRTGYLLRHRSDQQRRQGHLRIRRTRTWSQHHHLRSPLRLFLSSAVIRHMPKYHAVHINYEKTTHKQMHTYTSTYTSTFIRTYIYTYIHIYTSTYIYSYSHTRIRAYIHTYIHTHTHVQTYVYTYVYECLHSYTHTYRHTYARAYIYTHICTRTYVQTQIYTYVICIYM
mmetsp:Transcript_1341/g.1815  ORF Transcript_1341/g.1815 Transcript_1341/m.1815 type:complete len:208 (+) Transcript_1341:967-1590(+)